MPSAVLNDDWRPLVVGLLVIVVVAVAVFLFAVSTVFKRPDSQLDDHASTHNQADGTNESTEPPDAERSP
jgi:hypothetical protein